MHEAAAVFGRDVAPHRTMRGSGGGPWLTVPLTVPLLLVLLVVLLVVLAGRVSVSAR